ncbi:UNVERIFIED_CONTAM: Jerky-like protein [Trichonephila clavipes]
MASNSKQKRNVLNIETKLEILNRLVKGESGGSLAQFYNKERKTVRGANDILLDRALYLWFSHRRSKGDPILGPLLCEKALELSKNLGGSDKFKASIGYLQNFKSRHGIRELQIESESLSGDENSAHKFKETFLQSGEEEGYTRDDVYNLEETGVNWMALPRKSLDSKT